MKKLKLMTLFFLIALTPIFQSCLDDNDSDYYNDSFAISTINVLDQDKKDFYFTLDDGSKMYPSEKPGMGNYEVKDGQRAFVLFKELDQKIDGYKYNIQVRNIVDILTKDIVDLTSDNVSDIGDDPINATYMWVAQGFLTIEFQYYGTHSSDKKHFLNLVVNKLPEGTEGDADSDYLELEFRHNKKGDEPVALGEGYVSFKLDKIAEEMKGKKGLKIRINTIHEGVKFKKVDFPESSK